MAISGRSPQLDNLKFILILLVACGHIIEPTAMQGGNIGSIYCALYVFHIPAFAFCAGITSHRTLTISNAVGIALLLALFQLAYVSKFALPDFPYLIQPYWLLWYLLSFFFWRLCLPLFYAVRYPIILALLIALLSGLLPFIGYDFSASRTLVFLPFFIAGHFRGARLLTHIQTLPISTRILIALLGACIVYAASQFIPAPQWLYGSYSYAALSTPNALALIYRLVHLGAGMAGILALICIIPNRDYRWSARGQRVLPIYLLHGFFIAPLANIAALFLPHGLLPMLGISLVFAAWLAFALSADFINAIIRTLYHPEALWQQFRQWRS